MGEGLALLGAGGFSGSGSWSVVSLFVLSCSASCRRQSEKILNRFWIGMLGFVSIPAVGVVVGLESETDVDLDLLRTVIGTYSVAFPFQPWPGPCVGLSRLRRAVRDYARMYGTEISCW